MTTTITANLATDHAHSEPKNRHALILTLLFLGWVVALAAATVVFGLGGLITAATFTAWGVLALLVVMTAGG